MLRVLSLAGLHKHVLARVKHSLQLKFSAHALGLPFSRYYNQPYTLWLMSGSGFWSWSSLIFFASSWAELVVKIFFESSSESEVAAGIIRFDFPLSIVFTADGESVLLALPSRVTKNFGEVTFFFDLLFFDFLSVVSSPVFFVMKTRWSDLTFFDTTTFSISSFPFLLRRFVPGFSVLTSAVLMLLLTVIERVILNKNDEKKPLIKNTHVNISNVTFEGFTKFVEKNGKKSHAFLKYRLHPNRSSRTIPKIKLSWWTDFWPNCPVRPTSYWTDLGEFGRMQGAYWLISTTRIR